jgi:hypothetical protein
LLTDRQNAALPATVPALVADVARSRRPVPDATLTALLRAVERIEDLLDEETAELKNHRAIDLASFIHRKGQGLLELTRASRAMNGYEVEPAVADRLARLRDKLERNQAVLQLHLDAVREVADLLAKAARDAESDGTYSMPGYRQDNG